MYFCILSGIAFIRRCGARVRLYYAYRPCGGLTDIIVLFSFLLSDAFIQAHAAHRLISI